MQSRLAILLLTAAALSQEVSTPATRQLAGVEARTEQLANALNDFTRAALRRESLARFLHD